MRDVSFNLEPGEAVSIIGIYGAGKSSLLKMITGIAQPTSGSVEIAGRVAALLEIGGYAWILLQIATVQDEVRMEP
jgi:lipopolysaccharide transport system ATP-binding protein